MSGAGYTITWTGPAQRALRKLPEKAAVAAVEFIYGSLAENPERVGKPLRRELAGLRSARRGEYRVIYRIIPFHPTRTCPSNVVQLLLLHSSGDTKRRDESIPTSLYVIFLSSKILDTIAASEKRRTEFALTRTHFNLTMLRGACCPVSFCLTASLCYLIFGGKWPECRVRIANVLYSDSRNSFAHLQHHRSLHHIYTLIIDKKVHNYVSYSYLRLRPGPISLRRKSKISR